MNTEKSEVHDYDPDLEDMDEQVARRYRQDTEERKTFSKWVRRLIGWYFVLVFVLLILYGVGVLRFPQPVVVTLLGTTTLNVLGLSYIILHGLFDK